MGGTDTRPSVLDGLAVSLLVDYRQRTIPLETYYEMENSPR